MRYFATFALVFIFLLLAISSAIIPQATIPALAVLILLPLVWYLEHTTKLTGDQ